MTFRSLSVRYGWAKNPICNLYNSAELPASPFRTDIWASGISYETFTSTCNNNADNKLLTILLNGKKIKDFSADKLSYTATVNELPQVTAYTNFPFAKVTIVQPSEENGRKAQITVTAENATQTSYENIFSISSRVQQNIYENISFYSKNGKIMIENGDESAHVCIVNSLGQVFGNQKINSNSVSVIEVPNSGIYLLQVNTVSGKQSNAYKIIVNKNY